MSCFIKIQIDVTFLMPAYTGCPGKDSVKRVTCVGLCCQTYAWLVLESLFSEVLTGDEWLCLMDNVFSNHPSFLLVAVVAYCVVGRTALLRCTERDDFEVGLYLVSVRLDFLLTTHTQPFYDPFRDHPGEPLPEENFWTLWCKGRLTEADTPTVRLGATPSGLTSAHLHHPPNFFTDRMPFLPPN